MDNIASAVEFVANHFDTVEKAGTNVAGVVIAAAAFWIGRKTISALAYFARCTYAAAKHRVAPPPDPVFVRLLKHFDDPDAMFTPTHRTPSKDGDTEKRIPACLEAGTLVTIFEPDTGDIRCVKDTKNKDYDIYKDLTAAEKKVIDRIAAAKVRQVVERDRVARRATLSAPIV